MDDIKNRRDWRKAWEDNQEALRTLINRPPQSIDEGEDLGERMKKLKDIIATRKELMEMWGYIDIISR